MNPSQLLTQSLRSAPWGETVTRVLAAALNAVEPGAAVANFLHSDGRTLQVAGRAYPLDQYRRVRVVGAGKAGAPMARAVAAILGERLTDGLVVVKEGHTGEGAQAGPVRIIEAGHPVPDERSVRAANGILDLLSAGQPDDLVICLISGGGSALLVSPIPGVSLADLQGLTQALLACGATINEINSLRKHLDQVKGGGLARRVAPAGLITLILSDVVGDPLDVIASGPTVPDTSTFGEAWGVIERYGLAGKIPPAIVAHLQRGVSGEAADTPKAGDPLFAGVQNVIVGSNAQAAEAALAQARAEGLNGLLLTTFLQGEARQVGRMLGAIARQMAADGQPLPRPACLIAGGETTVTLLGKGMGGRNQEMALAAAGDLAGLPNVAVVTLATDGGDGPTDACGAVATGETSARARQLGLTPAAFLANSDSYHFFDPLGDLIKPGPTQTNVNDLEFVFAF